MSPVEGDWANVQRHARRAVDERHGGSASRAAAAVGADWRTLDKILNGKPVNRRPALVRLTVALGWPPDGFDRALRGEDPVPAEPTNEPAAAPEQIDDAWRASIEARLDRHEERIDQILAQLEEGRG